jgi:acetyl esterase/lipase
VLATIAALVAPACTAATSTPWQPPPGHVQLPLWPGLPPGERATPDAESTAVAENPVAGRPWSYVRYVSLPTLTVFPPRARNTGAAFLVMPGGGYQILAIDLEGTEVCDWLSSIGITGVLLKYRVPNSGPTWEQFCGCDTRTRSSRPLEDAQRAISFVRAHAGEWHLDPHEIGVIGFSAGGGLVASLSTRFSQRAYAPVDAADSASCRPDFAVAVYPGHLFSDRTKALNPDLHVTRSTPPTLLVQARNDPVDPVANSLQYAAALRRGGVPVELHLFAEGGHAFGLRPTKLPITAWPRLVETWLQGLGVIPR